MWLVAVTVLCAGAALIFRSLYCIEHHLPRCESDALRMYHEGRAQIIGAIGYIAAILGFGMLYQLNDPEEVGPLNLSFLLMLALSVYWIYDGLARLDEAKKPPLEEG